MWASFGFAIGPVPGPVWFWELDNPENEAYQEFWLQLRRLYFGVPPHYESVPLVQLTGSLLLDTGICNAHVFAERWGFSLNHPATLTPLATLQDVDKRIRRISAIAHQLQRLTPAQSDDMRQLWRTWRWLMALLLTRYRFSVAYTEYLGDPAVGEVINVCRCEMLVWENRIYIDM